MNSTGRKLLAEFVGTFLLVFLAVGAAVFGIGAKVGTDGAGPGNGVVGVALAFGLVLLAMAYAFGPVSGAHVNPAVTLAMLIGRRMPTNEAVGYWIAQFLGGILGVAGRLIGRQLDGLHHEVVVASAARPHPLEHGVAGLVGGGPVTTLPHHFQPRQRRMLAPSGAPPHHRGDQHHASEHQQSDGRKVDRPSVNGVGEIGGEHAPSVAGRSPIPHAPHPRYLRATRFSVMLTPWNT